MVCKYAKVFSDGEILGCKHPNQEWKDELQKFLYSLEDDGDLEFFDSGEFCKVCPFRATKSHRIKTPKEAQKYLGEIVENEVLSKHL